MTKQDIVDVLSNFPDVEFPDDSARYALDFPDGSYREVPINQHPSPATAGAKVRYLIISEEIAQLVCDAKGNPDALERAKAEYFGNPEKN